MGHRHQPHVLSCSATTGTESPCWGWRRRSWAVATRSQLLEEMQGCLCGWENCPCPRELFPMPESPTHLAWKLTQASRVKAGPIWSIAEGRVLPGTESVQTSQWPPNLEQGTGRGVLMFWDRALRKNPHQRHKGPPPKLQHSGSGFNMAEHGHVSEPTLAGLPLISAEPRARINIPHVEKHTFLNTKLKNM